MSLPGAKGQSRPLPSTACGRDCEFATASRSGRSNAHAARQSRRRAAAASLGAVGNLICDAEGANALIIGTPSTEKSHVAKAVAYQATLQGHDVRYVEANTEFARLRWPAPRSRRR